MTLSTHKYFLNTVTATGTRVTVCKICGAVVYEGNLSIDGKTIGARLVHLASHAVTEMERDPNEETEQE